jgi:hypothetical protein
MTFITGSNIFYISGLQHSVECVIFLCPSLFFCLESIVRIIKMQSGEIKKSIEVESIFQLLTSRLIWNSYPSRTAIKKDRATKI